MKFHTAVDRSPFTYLIKFKPTGQVYYGCRYGVGCHPSDLFTIYFTSSKIVKKMIKVYGIKQFEYEVRQVFTSIRACINWEQRVLQKFDVLTNPLFLNFDSNLNASGAIQNKFKVMAISNIITGKSVRIPVNDLIPEGWVLGNVNNYKSKSQGLKWYYNPETQQEIYSTVPVEGCIPGRDKNKIRGSGHKDFFKINNGFTTKYHQKSDPIPEGWIKGDLSNIGSLGKIWINNGSVSKYLTKGETIPQGWSHGRVKKKKD